jgi:hypothetical protein
MPAQQRLGPDEHPVPARARQQPGQPSQHGPVGPVQSGSDHHKAASQKLAFFDVTKGSNDLAGVGCCQATVGNDPASGLGVPNWATLPATLPKPS